MKDFFLSAPVAPNLRIDYANELNEEQLAVVEHGDGACLVLAGAGSGKTRTVTYRVAWLLEHGVAPDRILLLTFTNKAAKEMITRLEVLLKAYPTGLWAGTFHSIANRLLRQYGQRTDYGSNFSILDEEDAIALLKLCAKEQQVAKLGQRFPSASVLKSVSSYATNAQLDLDTVIAKRLPEFVHLTEEIKSVLHRYMNAKQEQRVMDFDDLLLVLLQLLQQNQELRVRLAERFEYVLVDEFQDTNLLQAQLVNILASEHQNLLVVGDDAQSIYSFRAAEIRNILNFPKVYTGAQVFRLVTNYRSTPQILQVANAVIENNPEQFEKQLQAVMPDGDRPALVPANDQRQEAQYVTEQILQLMDEGVELGEIAVLFRAAFHSQALEFELMKRNLPYEYRGGLKFFERAHIKDAIAHLRLLRNHQDSVAWIRVLQIHPGLGLVTANKIAQQAGQLGDLLTALATPPRVSAKALLGWQRASKILTVMSQQQTSATALRALANAQSYKEYLEAEYPNYRDRLEDLEQFAIFAEQYDDIGTFLDAVTLTGDFGAQLMDTETDVPVVSSVDKLVLSTIHQAKGLEWDNVFIINLADGAFPSRRSTSEDEIAEERRLFYVATTRARKRLFLTYPLTSGFEHIELRQPSQFIDEIPAPQLEMVKLHMPAYRAATYAARAASDWPDEPTIVLDKHGEPLPADKTKHSFLRNLDEL